VRREQARAVVYGLIVTAGFAALDIALGSNARISGAYGLGAIVAGVLAGFRPSLIVSAIAIPLAAVSGIWNDDFGETGYFARLFVAGAAALLAAGAGRLRDDVANQLERQQLLAAVADLPAPGAGLDQTITSVLDLLVPRYAAFGAIEGSVRSEAVRLGVRGTEPLDDGSVLRTPLRTRGRAIGTLVTNDGRAGVEDAQFTHVLSGRIALALDNAGLSQELVTVEQQLQAILENLGEAVTVQDPSGRLVFANRTAAELLGAASVEELLATPPVELVERFTTVTEDGIPLDVADLPGRAVLEGREAKPLVVRTRNNITGQETWRVTKSTAVNGPGGEVLLAVNVIEDITESKRSELAQRLLADASGVLASSLDYERTLQQVAELAVPEFADWCSVSLLRGEATELVAAAPRDRDPGVSDAPIVVPMATAERTVGAMSFAATESARQFTEADLELARELARRAATAVENARLYTELERVATTLQRSLLPPRLPDVPGWQFNSLYMPAGGENEVGGDFYDVFPTAAGWMAIMGDVVGRGAAAASLTAMGRYTLRTAGSLVGTPTMGLARLNENLRERGEMALCTAAVVLMRAASNEASLVCAGHPLPYLIRDGEVQAVGRTGPLLGAFEQGHWLPASLELLSGDVLVLSTDGGIDARGGNGRFGEQRREQTLAGAGSAHEAVARIRAALSEFGGTEQDDDTAVLAMQKL
jgi:PAS domain S-box-containing protein